MNETPESPQPAPPSNPAPPQPPPASAAHDAAPSADERQFALFIHLSALIGFFIPLANIIAPLILWQIKKNESSFIDDQGKEAVNFNITMLIAGFALFVLTLITLGILAILTIPAGLALAVAFLVFAILAGIKANEGEAYRYPFILRLIK